MIRKPEFLKEFDEDADHWRPLLVSRFGSDFANAVLIESREVFEALIPQIPYIGGDETLTGSLIGSVKCLAFYKALKKRGGTADEAGRILYDAILARKGGPQTPASGGEALTTEQRMERRKMRAEMSHKIRCVEGYVYEFVTGDGREFDYGYDFTECAAQKFYHVHGADEFLPFYCFLDYPSSRVLGLGLTRTMTLAEGHATCDHRFKRGRTSELEWPPPFLKHE